MRYERLDTRLEGVGLVQAKLLGDERGFFVETYRSNDLANRGIVEEMVQDNHSRVEVRNRSRDAFPDRPGRRRS